MRFKKIIKMFENGNVCVTGMRGKGKDLIIGNVIAHRKKQYVSNLNYRNEYHNELDFNKIDCQNDYKNFINGNINYYEYPYPLGADVYISDCGVYLPSQYCNQLNRDYPNLITYQALSRQISRNNVHINAQNINRVWDKIREQSDTYIRCVSCIYLFGLVIQRVIIYDKYESCLNRVNPCRIKVPLFNKEAKIHARLYLDNFYNQHGKVQSRLLFYFNRSKHNTYQFGEILKKGKKKNENT